MSKNIPPTTDPTTLSVGTIGMSYGFAFIVQDDAEKGLYWKDIDNLLEWDNIDFWTIETDLDFGVVKIIPKKERLVIDGKNTEVSNPIPITISFSNTQVKSEIQDYGGVYSQQNNWADLLKIDPLNPFSENNRQIKKKLSDDIGEDWKYKERLKTELEENLFPDSEEGQRIVYQKIIDSWIDVFTFVNDVATKFYKPQQPEETPKRDFEIGDFVVFIKDTNEVLKIVNWGESGKAVAKTVRADGFNDTTKPHLVTSLRLFDKQPKFKVGDRILYPTKQNGGDLGGSAKTLIDKAKAEKLGYLVVTDVTYNRYDDEVFNYWLGFQDLPNASVSFLEEECKPYDPSDKTPEDIIRKGEFFVRNENVWLATEDSTEGRGFQYIVMESFRYIEQKFSSKWKYFWETDLAHRHFGEIGLGLGYSYEDGFKFFLEKGGLKIQEDNVKNLGVAETIAQRIILFLATFDRELSDEYEKIWLKLEQGVESGIIRADWRSNPKPDCEADPNKIISGQVKKFYDLNKTRIDKLDTKISCKIIQALVGLSEYESCGSPSSSSLPKAKTDLLSRISNLKI
jgi:hypothetical protein